MGCTTQGLNPGRGMRFLFSPKLPDRICGPVSRAMDTEVFFSGVKWLGHEVGHSPPSVIKV